jgi:hypothetical protein
MTTINTAQFVDAVQNWAKLRDPSFKFYWPVKGGWEGWIQVDLTAFIIDKLPTLDILREQPIFKNERQKVDLLINADQNPDNQIAVEMKAQSFENRDRFIKLVESDLDKLTDMNPAYAYTTCVVLAATFNQATLDELLGLERDDHEIFWTISVSREVAFAVAEWNGIDGWVYPDVRAGGARRKPTRPRRAGSSTMGFGPASAFAPGGGFGDPYLVGADQ